MAARLPVRRRMPTVTWPVGAAIAAATGPPATFGDFWEAMVARVADALGDGLPGGIFLDRREPGAAWPYAVYLPDEGGRSAFDSSGRAVDGSTFEVRIYTLDSRPRARALAKATLAALDDAPLAFDDGTLLLLRHDSPPTVGRDPAPGPSDEVVYYARLSFRYLIDT